MGTWLSIIVSLITNLPSLIKAVKAIILVVEEMLPNATGPQKLNAAVSMVEDNLPAVTSVVSLPFVQSFISGLVSAGNKPGGVLAEMKEKQAVTADPTPQQQTLIP